MNQTREGIGKMKDEKARSPAGAVAGFAIGVGVMAGMWWLWGFDFNERGTLALGCAILCSAAGVVGAAIGWCGGKIEL